MAPGPFWCHVPPLLRRAVSHLKYKNDKNERGQTGESGDPRGRREESPFLTMLLNPRPTVMPAPRLRLKRGLTEMALALSAGRVPKLSVSLGISGMKLGILGQIWPAFASAAIVIFSLVAPRIKPNTSIS